MFKKGIALICLQGEKFMAVILLNFSQNLQFEVFELIIDTKESLEMKIYGGQCHGVRNTTNLYYDL